jgi:uncharacterized protein YukE
MASQLTSNQVDVRFPAVLAATTKNPVEKSAVNPRINLETPAKGRFILKQEGGNQFPVKTMSQAIIDPEEVRRFAAELKRFNGDLRERTGSLMARFTALGDTWQDQEQEKFAAEFTQLMKTLKSFLELSDRHTPYLLRKAERIQQYLDQR